MKQSANGSNNYDVSYSVIAFFEKALRGNKAVIKFERNNDLCFEISTIKNITLKVFLVNDYILGIARIFEILSDFPEIEYIVTGGNWNGYTKEAKDYGRDNGIGIFVSDEFFGAIWKEDPKTYTRKDDDGNPIFKYK